MSTPRDAMLDSAITLFRERGVADTSMRDIVEHSGAPRGSIYHHFPGGKDQLAGEATALAGDFIGGLLDLKADEDPALAIRSFVDHWRTAMRSKAFRDGCPVAAAALTDDTPSARRAAGEAFARWERTLAAGLERRGSEPGRAAALATLAIASIEGALILSRATGSDEPLVRVGELLPELLSV